MKLNEQEQGDADVRDEIENFARTKGYRLRGGIALVRLANFAEHEVENRDEGNEGPWACPLCNSGDFSWPLSIVNHIIERHPAKVSAPGSLSSSSGLVQR